MAFSDFTNGVLDYGRRFTPAGWTYDIVRNASSSGSYSDFVTKSNQATDGWYGTVANAIPYVRDAHNAVLDRDRTLDVLNNTGRDWGDVLGYNSNGITAGTGSSLGNLTTKIEDGVHDLFQFYSGEEAKNDRHNRAQVRAVKSSLKMR